MLACCSDYFPVFYIRENFSIKNFRLKIWWSFQVRGFLGRLKLLMKILLMKKREQQDIFRKLIVFLQDSSVNRFAQRKSAEILSLNIQDSPNLKLILNWNLLSLTPIPYNTKTNQWAQHTLDKFIQQQNSNKIN